MNEEQIDVVKSTWGMVVPIADAAAGIFYDKLFEMDPSVRAMFPDDLTEQKKKLMQTLGTLVHALGHLETVLPAVESLAVRHIDYGVREDHYPTVGAALLATLETGLGDAWTPEVKDAWTNVYSVVSQVMISAARKASASEMAS